MSRVGPLHAYDIETTKEDYSIQQYLTEDNQREVPEVEKTRLEKNRAYRMASILWDHNDKHSDYSNAHHTVVAIEVTILLDMVHGFRKTLPDHRFLLNMVSTLS